MFYSARDAIAVTATGVAEAKIGRVDYSVIARKREETGPAARIALTQITSNILQTIERMALAAGIDTQHIKTTMDIGSVYTRDAFGNSTFAGYEAVFKASFSGTAVERATGVYEALTYIGGVEAPTPVFQAADREEAEALAFRNAVREAKQRFSDQCRALDMDPANYVVNTWEIRDATHQGKSMRIAEDESLQPGHAEIQKEVSLLFVPKPTQQGT